MIIKNDMINIEIVSKIFRLYVFLYLYYSSNLYEFTLFKLRYLVVRYNIIYILFIYVLFIL